MLHSVGNRDDLKTAALLAGVFAFFAAISAPLMLEFIPADSWTPPVPVPVWAMIVAVQSLVLYGLASWAGLRLARQCRLEPAPVLTSFWRRQRPPRLCPRFVLAFASGLLCGIALVVFVALIRRRAPQTLPRLLHPPSLSLALLASTAAALGEELLFRLFLLSAILRLLARLRFNTQLAVVSSALLFAAAHAPGFVFLFGGFQSMPALAWLWLIVLNGLVGVVCGTFFVKFGIGGAILVHFGTDLVWHVLSQLGS